MLPTTASARSARTEQMSSTEDIRQAEPYALSHTLSYLLCIMYRDLMACTEQRTLPHGISASQWRFLRALHIEDGITQRELSRRIGLREPTTVRALKTLEQHKFVRRSPDSDDRRKINVYLTSKARSLVSSLVPMIFEVNEYALNDFTEEEAEMFKRFMLRGIRNLRQNGQV